MEHIKGIIEDFFKLLKSEDINDDTKDFIRVTIDETKDEIAMIINEGEIFVEKENKKISQNNLNLENKV